MQEFVTHSREETVAVGRELAKTLPAGALIAFTGGLGAGKTAFCQGLAEGLGCTDRCPADVCHRELLPRPAALCAF